MTRNKYEMCLVCRRPKMVGKGCIHCKAEVEKLAAAAVPKKGRKK